MSPQLAEAQQPPAIVERADRFANTANPSSLQPVKTDFRSEFVADAVDGQSVTTQRAGLSPEVEQLLRDLHHQRLRPFDPGSLIVTPGVSDYRGQSYATHSMTPREDGQIDYAPLNETQINAQKTGIDARLSGRFSTEEVTQLQTLAQTSEQLVGHSLHSKALEHQLAQKDFGRFTELKTLEGLQSHYSTLAQEPHSEALKLELQTVGEKFGRTYQRGMFCLSRGKAPDDEFARLQSEAIEELGQLRRKISAELVGNMDRVKTIATQSASRAAPPEPEASAQAAQHIQRLASCIVADAGGERLSGKQIARQIGRL